MSSPHDVLARETGVAGRWGRRVDLSLVAAGAVLLLLVPRNLGSDGQPRVDAVRAMADGHLLHERFSLVVPLLALPLELLGRAVGHEQSVLYLFNGLVFAAGLLALWLLLPQHRDRLLGPVLLLLVFGSVFPAHVTSFFGETVTAVGVLVGLLLLCREGTGAAHLLGWAVLVLAVVNTPAALPALGLLVLVMGARRRSFWPLLALPLAFLLSLVDLRLHTGGFANPYGGDSGYQTLLPYSGRPGFSYPAILGILVIVFSFGKGLLFFVPGLFLPARGLASDVLRELRVLGSAFVVGLVLVYCRWWAWYGGMFWGPRFFLFASLIGALVLGARLTEAVPSWRSGVVTLGALTLSAWGAGSAVLGNVGQDVCVSEMYAHEYLCWYSPEFSVLWTPVRNFPSTTAAQKVYLVLVVCAFLRLATSVALSTWRASREALASWWTKEKVSRLDVVSPAP